MSAARLILHHPIRLAYALAVLVFLAAVVRFYQPQVGFSSLIYFGDTIVRTKVEALRNVPHFIYEDSVGYDGAYYAQLALNPKLTNPELDAAIDNPGYRARRMLCYWLAWTLGLGQPAWIVQAYALINVGCWLMLAWLLLRWFPPTQWDNFVRWAGVMFSFGLCASVRGSLVDGPSLLLIALALRAIELRQGGAGTAFLAAAVLAKETGYLATPALAGIQGGMATKVGPSESAAPEQGAKGKEQRAEGERQSESVLSVAKNLVRKRLLTKTVVQLRWVGLVLLAAVPLLAWMAYVYARFGPPNAQELRNFAYPLTGLAEQWGTVIGNFVEHPFRRINRLILVATIAVTAQFLFFVTWRRPDNPWWRVGASFVILLVFLATPVWEGYPGAFSRVLLPMTLAFNVLVPRGRSWLPLLLAGNLGVLAGVQEARAVPREFIEITGEPRFSGVVKFRPGAQWYPTESTASEVWRWSSGDGAIAVTNPTDQPLRISLSGRVAPARDYRRVEMAVRGTTLWSAALSPAGAEFSFTFTAPPGRMAIDLHTDRPPQTIGADLRPLAFKLSNLRAKLQPTEAAQ